MTLPLYLRVTDCTCCAHVLDPALARLLPADCLRPCPTGADPGVSYAPLGLGFAALNRMAYPPPDHCLHVVREHRSVHGGVELLARWYCARPAGHDGPHAEAMAGDEGEGDNTERSNP